MSKEGIPAVYEVSDAAIKNIDRVRHYNKTEQDKLPVAQRPRHMEANSRRRLQSEHKIQSEHKMSAVDGLIISSMQGNI